MKQAKIANSYHNPTALFPTRGHAFEAALAINDSTQSLCCSYWRVDAHLWKIEAVGVTLPNFLHTLNQAGCKPL